MMNVYPERNWEYAFEDGRAIWAGGHIDLTPQEAAIFGLLHKAYPHKMSNRRLIAALYPDSTLDADLPDDPASAIHVHASHIRHKLIDAAAPFRLPFGDYFGLWLEVIA